MVYLSMYMSPYRPEWHVSHHEYWAGSLNYMVIAWRMARFAAGRGVSVRSITHKHGVAGRWGGRLRVNWGGGLLSLLHTRISQETFNLLANYGYLRKVYSKIYFCWICRVFLVVTR